MGVLSGVQRSRVDSLKWEEQAAGLFDLYPGRISSINRRIMTACPQGVRNGHARVNVAGDGPSGKQESCHRRCLRS
jgi:hypothetical protein